jgi:hypothetical protein
MSKSNNVDFFIHFPPLQQEKGFWCLVLNPLSFTIHCSLRLVSRFEIEKVVNFLIPNHWINESTGLSNSFQQFLRSKRFLQELTVLASFTHFKLGHLTSPFDFGPYFATTIFFV